MGALSQQIPTLEEVAELAGVSRATASRVITGNPRVSPKARRAVERAARKLGYVPNRAARSLVRKRTDSIGLVIPEPTTQLFGDPFFPRLVRGVNEEAAARGFQLVLFTPQTPSDEERLEQYIVGGHVDGVLLVSLHGDDPLPKHFAERRVHAVVGGRPPTDAPVSFVDIDNEGGARQAVRHLASRGRVRIGTIAGRMDMPVGVDRLAGYRAELAAAGIAHDSRLEAVGDFTAEGGARAARELLARVPDLDAVFVASDPMASAALRVFAEAGRTVPDDIAVVSFDDSPIAVSTQPTLSSVRQPIEEMGREMTRLLMRAIEGENGVPRRVILPAELIVRASSGEVTGE
jgi:DNA-binding LacI/PurR family transcriptional regulator